MKFLDILHNVHKQRNRFLRFVKRIDAVNTLFITCKQKKKNSRTQNVYFSKYLFLYLGEENNTT